MTCAHEKRSVLGIEGGDGKMVYGMPPRSEEEPAWCINCGALWAQTLLGWGWLNHFQNRSAPTLANRLRRAHAAEESMAAAGVTVDEDKLAEMEADVAYLRSLAKAEEVPPQTNPLALTLALLGRSLLSNNLIRGLVLRVVAEEGAFQSAGPLKIIYLRHDCPEAAHELSAALEDVHIDLAVAEKIVGNQEPH